MNVKITVDKDGRLTSASLAQIRSSLGGIIGNQLAAMALPQIQREVQQHVAAQSRPRAFMSAADFCAKSAGSTLFNVPDDLTCLTFGMTMRSVESSSLRRVGYNQTSSTLRIEFKAGGLWDYLRVPASEYEKLMKAESPGGYFYSHIRHRFQSRKVL